MTSQCDIKKRIGDIIGNANGNVNMDPQMHVPNAYMQPSMPIYQAPYLQSTSPIIYIIVGCFIGMLLLFTATKWYEWFKVKDSGDGFGEHKYKNINNTMKADDIFNKLAKSILEQKKTNNYMEQRPPLHVPQVEPVSAVHPVPVHAPPPSPKHMEPTTLPLSQNLENDPNFTPID